MLRRLDASVAVAELGTARVVDDDILDAVRQILAEVRSRGDAALREYTERFDGCRLDSLRVAPTEVKGALEVTPPEVRAALEYTAERIWVYHEAQAAVPPPDGIDADGIAVAEVVRPVDRVGLYVPGGRAAYPSTVLMTAIPARIAGVPEIAACVPAGRDGRVPEVTLAAASLAGVDEIYRVGGAQAIAALAYGTETIRPVDVIVGPGNAYVAAAKREVAGAGVVGIEAPAGPSEVVVVADATAPPDLVAADLAAQAEHGPWGFSVLVTWDASVADAVDASLSRLVRGAESQSIDVSALATGGRSVIAGDAEEAMEVVNAIAPEHVELMVGDPEPLLGLLRHAGAVFVGPWAAAAMGDYVAGANHVLPTGRAARFASALRVDDFRTHIHVVRATREGAERASREGAVLARAEGLEGHAWSLVVRTRP